MTSIFSGDVGTTLIVNCGIDISASTVQKLIVKPPRGTKREWDCSIEGTTQIKYVLGEGDINIPGTWLIQAYIEMPGWSGRGEWVELDVHV